MTIAPMSLADVTHRVQQALDAGVDFRQSVKFDFGAAGSLFVDGVAARASNDDRPADAVISVSFDDFVALVQNRLDPMQAVISRKVQINGDMGVAMKLRDLLGQRR
jgi:putative sterol carrier protein